MRIITKVDTEKKCGGGLMDSDESLRKVALRPDYERMRKNVRRRRTKEGKSTARQQALTGGKGKEMGEGGTVGGYIRRPPTVS